jgi:hypothetical protein
MRAETIIDDEKAVYQRELMFEPSRRHFGVMKRQRYPND